MRAVHFLMALAAASVFARPARAIDCAAARSDVDKAICRTPALKAADAAMAAAYWRAYDAAGGAERAALRASQRTWIRLRGAGCDGDGAASAACLIEETDARRAFLQARPEGGPGLGTAMRRVLVIRESGKGTRYSADVELLAFVDPKTPGERRFNAEVATLVAGIPTTLDGLNADQTGYYDLAMRVTWAAPRLISARLDGDEFDGGAYPNALSWGINIDAATGRRFAFADAFDAAAHGTLAADCLAQILRQKSQRGAYIPTGDEAAKLRANVDKGVGDLAGWSFSARGARVTFGPDYFIGPHAEGDYACHFPLARLKPLARAGFPLPE